MAPQEADKIIAEYMNERVLRWCLDKKLVMWWLGKFNNTEPYLYSKSLDALVPVWKKLKEEVLRIELDAGWRTPWAKCYHTGGTCGATCNGNTIQEAAAVATAIAIQETNI